VNTLRPATDYLNRHAGETAWLFGKGPSLRQFIDEGGMEKAGPLRVAINDVMRYVPGCKYCFSNDHVNQSEHGWADLYTPEHTLMTVRRTWENKSAYGEPELPCDVVAVRDICEPSRLTWSRQKLAEQGFTTREGTLGTALQYLHVMGVTAIIAVGIDGGQCHAPGFDWRTNLRNEHYKAYNRIRNCFIADCQKLGIALRFYGKPEHQTNGTMKVRMLRTRFVRGTAYEAGELCSPRPDDSALLVAQGHAEYIVGTEPQAEVIETTAKAQPRETATKRTVKRATKKASTSTAKKKG